MTHCGREVGDRVWGGRGGGVQGVLIHHGDGEMELPAGRDTIFLCGHEEVR